MDLALAAKFYIDKLIDSVADMKVLLLDDDTVRKGTSFSPSLNNQ
jgi:hypothetical protein